MRAPPCSTADSAGGGRRDVRWSRARRACRRDGSPPARSPASSATSPTSVPISSVAPSRSWTCVRRPVRGSGPRAARGSPGRPHPGQPKLPYAELVAPDGTLLPPDALETASGRGGHRSRHGRSSPPAARARARAPSRSPCDVLGHPAHGGVRRVVDRMGRTDGHAGRDRAGVTAPAPEGRLDPHGRRLRGAVPAAVRRGRHLLGGPAPVALHKSDWKQAGFLAIFALAFGGVGIGGIAAVLAGRGRADEALAREARHPDAPWLWREEWAARRVSDSSRAGMWGAWAFTALWNLISLPSAVLAVRSALHEGNRIALSRWCSRWSEWDCSSGRSGRRSATAGTVSRRSSSRRCRPSSATRSKGSVRTPAGLRPAEGFRATLNCIRRVTSGSGRNRSTSETDSLAGGAPGRADGRSACRSPSRSPWTRCPAIRPGRATGSSGGWT